MKTNFNTRLEENTIVKLKIQAAKLQIKVCNLIEKIITEYFKNIKE